MCAANDLWTQKNLTLSLVQKGEGAHMKHNSTLHWCASTSNGYFDIKRCVSFKKSKDQGYEKIPFPLIEVSTDTTNYIL